MYSDQELRWCALMIRARRSDLGWSQESVCKGVCAVSYYSKIESLSVIPSMEIIESLAVRLEFSLPLPSFEDKRRFEEIYAQIERGHTREIGNHYHDRRPAFASSIYSRSREIFSLMTYMQDEETLHLAASIDRADFLSCLDSRMRALVLIGLHEFEQAVLACPKAWVMMNAAFSAYKQRKNDAAVLEMFLQADRQAWKEGHAFLIGQISHLIAIVYSNIPDSDSAHQYFERARNLMEDVHDEYGLSELAYNEACVNIQEGNFEEALAILEKIEDPGVMDLHKLCICYEQTNQKDKALALLGRVSFADPGDWSKGTIDQLFAVCSLRLQNPNYLEDPVYGEQLMDLFETLNRSPLHKGFAQFHLPWVIQYLKHKRKYALIVKLMEDFPIRPLFTLS